MPEPRVEDFHLDSDNAPADWRWLWRGDHPPSLPSPSGPIDRLKLRMKRFLRRVVLGTQPDLWERQRIYNLYLLQTVERAIATRERLPQSEERLDRVEAEMARRGPELQTVQNEIAGDLRTTRDELVRDLNGVYDNLMGHLKAQSVFLESHHERITFLEKFRSQAFEELRRHLDGLYSRLDQRMDAYRRESRHLWSELQALLAALDGEGSSRRVARAAEERDYVELEARFRGAEGEIERRVDPYLEILAQRGPVLDLGCGRGEALEALARRGVAGRGVDANAEMVARCREKGLEVEEGDLFETLRSAERGSLGGILSLHVIEHLPAESLDTLVKLAWRALREGGVLILETPSPLSLVVAARNFWIDPTHRRPVHPSTLRHSFEHAGFDPVERVDLQPFASEDRLPDLPTDGLPPELAPLVERLQRLRDDLDRLLYGYQDFGMVGYKPSRAISTAAAPSG
jgi:O-antigen chain-terminating methyltransferase